MKTVRVSVLPLHALTAFTWGVTVYAAIAYDPAWWFFAGLIVLHIAAVASVKSALLAEARAAQKDNAHTDGDKPS